ncbi:MAG TPA: SDR family oxidoreductase [Propionibacteriaceae bacterium]|nr:SDR family oxidoreductase [Propionibacteriaceae bacterium]
MTSPQPSPGDTGGPVALVTGVSSGIGEAIAAKLLADGWNVVGISRRRPALKGPALGWIEVDLLDRAAVEKIIGAVGRVDAVVHAAGLQHTAYLGDLDPDYGDQMWRVHVDVPTRLVNALAARLPDGGRVVMLGSRTSTGVAGKSQYAATKAALDGLVRSWAIELAHRQITVNTVAPGPTETPMLADRARVATPPALPRLGRFIQPGEIADLVAFLLGPSGRSITGQRLVVCAGASL